MTHIPTHLHILGLATVALALGGCAANLSGLGGGSKYACKAPEGVTCDSVSGTYANAIHNNLPSQRQQAQQQPDALTVSPPPAARRVPLVPLALAPAIAVPEAAPQGLASSPLRSQARVLRLWTKPWEDADGDLYDQGYVYVQVNNGQWLIDHVQRQIRDAYAPLRPPPKTTAGPADETAPNAGNGTGRPTPSRPLSADTPSSLLGAPFSDRPQRPQ